MAVNIKIILKTWRNKTKINCYKTELYVICNCNAKNYQKILPPYLILVKSRIESPDYSGNLLNSREVNMKIWKWEKYLSTLVLITKTNNALKIADISGQAVLFQLGLLIRLLSSKPRVCCIFLLIE